MGERSPARVLVTGGAGFIGANFVRYWLGRSSVQRVVVLDALTYAGNVENLEGLDSDERYRFVHGDIRDRELVERLLSDEGLSTVVHLAAESHVDRSISGPDRFLDVNVLGTHSLLKAAREVWLGAGSRDDCLFHQVSTDEVYGSLGAADPPFSEESRYAPNSPYAASKAAADHLVLAYHRTYGLPATISNCSNNYGPYQLPEKLIPLCIVRLLEGQEVPIYGDGQNVRDWLHVDDHCRAIGLALESAPLGSTYCIGGGRELPNIELARRICSRLDSLFAARPELGELFPNCPAARGDRCEGRLTLVDDRPGHDQRYSIDAARIERDLGFRPSVEFDQGLDRTVAWFLERADWWRRVAG